MNVNIEIDFFFSNYLMFKIHLQLFGENNNVFYDYKLKALNNNITLSKKT